VLVHRVKPQVSAHNARSSALTLVDFWGKGTLFQALNFMDFYHFFSLHVFKSCLIVQLSGGLNWIKLLLASFVLDCGPKRILLSFALIPISLRLVYCFFGFMMTVETLIDV
jgi:hypothetical protein